MTLHKIIPFLALAGCCSVPSIQTVKTVEPIPVDPVILQYEGKSTDFSVDYSIQIDTTIPGKTVVTKTSQISVRIADTVRATNDNGLVAFDVSYRQSGSPEWKISATIIPDSIPKGTEVKATVKLPKPSWKEVHFWDVVTPLASLLIIFTIGLLILIRRR